MSMMQASSNPNQMLAQMAASNPTVRDVINLVTSSGKDPKTLFYEMAAQKGVDPESILSQLR